MHPPIILILAALGSESRALARAFNLRPRPHVRHSYGGSTLEFHTIGIRAIRIPDLTRPSIRLVILAGLAGGLDPTLNVGDVILDAQSTWPLTGLPHRRGNCTAATTVITTIQAKSQLHRDTEAAFVEMESDAVRQACAQANLPFLHLRAISDAATDVIDPAVLRFITPFGQLRPLALLATLARRPTLVKQLTQLARASSTALSALAPAVKSIVDGATHPPRFEL